MKKMCAILRHGYVKAFAFVAACAMAVLPARAQDGAGNGFDVSFAKTVLDNLKSTLNNFWTDNQNAILAVIGVVVVFTLVWFVIKLFKRGTSKA